MELGSVWLHFLFAASSFISNCFAESFIIPEMTYDDRVSLNSDHQIISNGYLLVGDSRELH